VTLIELLVVLVLLGLIFTISGLGLASLSPSRESVGIRALEAARAQAIRAGVPVGVGGDSAAVLFLPDGRALGPGIDHLTGNPRAAH
jgi:prepilin-type N-terminal cleavage/methylation domain-containing protein